MRRVDSMSFGTKTGKLVADASDLGFPPGVVVKEFEMETLGQIAKFELAGHFNNIDGDVMYWRYEADVALPGRKGRMEAVVYND